MSRFSTSDILLEARDLDLVFRIPEFGAWTARDQFVRWLSLRRRPSKRSLHVLHEVNFKLAKGDRLAILGVNGVGKSTLCRCLTGAYSPTRGSIHRNGRVRGVFDTAIGMYPELTGRENAKLMMHFLYPENRARHAQLMAEALEFSELGRFLDSPYRTYSNGMQARLALSLISCLPADILVLDEVFDGADEFFRAKIADRVLKTIQNSGASVCVSHSAEQIRAICNRALVLQNGHVRFDGPVDQAVELYRSLNSPASGDLEIL